MTRDNPNLRALNALRRHLGSRGGTETRRIYECYSGLFESYEEYIRERLEEDGEVVPWLMDYLDYGKLESKWRESHTVLPDKKTGGIHVFETR